MRTLLAISLGASMAAFGCTTNRNLGNGDPGNELEPRARAQHKRPPRHHE